MPSEHSVDAFSNVGSCLRAVPMQAHKQGALR